MLSWLYLACTKIVTLFLVDFHRFQNEYVSTNLNTQMVEPFQLTYLAGGGVTPPPPSLNLNHCLSDLLLIVDL